MIDLELYRFPSPQEIDYRNPLPMAEGIETVVVNGHMVIDAGELKPVFPGRVLRKA